MSGWKLVNMFGVSVKITSSLVISIDFHFLGHWMRFPEEHKDKNCTPLSSSIIANDILTRIFNFHTRNRMNRITSVDPATNYSSSTAMRESLRNPIGSKWSRRHPQGFQVHMLILTKLELLEREKQCFVSQIYCDVKELAEV